MILMSLALGARIKRLDAAKTRAEVTAEVKSRLLRITSHDLATPLTVIKATAQALKKSGHDHPRVDRIMRATEIMESIIHFVRKSESMPQGVELPRQPVPLQDIFEELAFLFQDRAQDKDLQLNFKLDPPDLTVFAERVSLVNEVLGNLLSNSIKFSFPRTAIDISACATHRGFVTIVIRDRGVGMEAALLKNLFDFSKKQSRPGTQGERGIGFGMPLVKAYIDAYGGTIEVESMTMDKDPRLAGTKVSITLPAVP
jgi:signal transduction histidine kinase